MNKRREAVKEWKKSRILLSASTITIIIKMASVAASEEPALSFVRNNPFVQNDLATTAKRHYTPSSPASRLPPAPPIVPAPTVVVVRDRSHSHQPTTTAIDADLDVGVYTPSGKRLCFLLDIHYCLSLK